MSKTKEKKTRQNKKRGTLDQKHTEKILRLEKINNSLPSKKRKLVKLENELDDLINISPEKYSQHKLHRKAQLKDSIEKLKSEIKSIENCTESLNYISDTLPILIDYYSSNSHIGDEIDFAAEQSNNGKKNILSYFFKDNNSDKTTNLDISKKISRAKLYSDYLDITDINYRQNSPQTNICSQINCGGEKFLSHDDGYIICRKCGLSEPILIPTEKPNYKEPTQDSTIYAYKRINHLTEILTQLQAKESTDIHQSVFENIQRELKKRKIEKSDLDIFKLRRILKTLNYRKYYEHVPHILQIISGKEPPHFSSENEAKIKEMFKDIQKPFALFCPKNRKNFLNYSYVLHKFCELLGLDRYIGYFPLLKNNTKLLQHDKIWKNICEYMRWEYIKSL